MRQVLIWKTLTPGSEYDIYSSIDCVTQYELALREGTFNVGNRLWLQGIMSAIDTGENHYEFLPTNIIADKVNEQFDFIILPMANIFNVHYVHYLESLADTFEKIKIPVYVIACGAQADSYDALDDLIEKIGDNAKRFIRAAYNTGGEFALRGEFTKQFFDRLGFQSAIVTGCPSLYQLGRDFRVSGTNYGAEIRPVFNGKISILPKLLEAYPDSDYMDQDTFLKDLCVKRINKPSFRDVFSFFCNYEPYAATLLAQDRIKLIPNMNDWRRYLMESGANFAFGSRIHGNIISLLSGIPATVVAIDTRTIEMADYFDIPYLVHKPGHIYTQKELENAYSKADYHSFNRNYQNKYKIFEDFLINHGIVSKVNQINSFFTDGKDVFLHPKGENTEYYQKVAKMIHRNSMLLDCAQIAVRTKNILRR